MGGHLFHDSHPHLLLDDRLSVSLILWSHLLLAFLLKPNLAFWLLLLFGIGMIFLVVSLIVLGLVVTDASLTPKGLSLIVLLL